MHTPPPADPDRASGPWRTVWKVAKWAIVLFALYYLWREGVLSRDRLALAGRAAWALPLAGGFLALSNLLVALRFHCLLRRLDCPSTFSGQCALVFPGLLVQQVGSDAAFDIMRIVGARRMGGGGSAIFAALMADRLLGLMALTALAMTALPLFHDGGSWLPAALGAMAFLLAVPVCFALFHSLRDARPGSWLERLPGSRFIAGIGEAVKVYRGSLPLLAGLFLTSLTAHGCVFAALYCCGLSLAGVDLRPAEAFLAGALSTFTGVLPLPLAGLGVGEVAFGAVVARMRGAGEAGDFAGVFLVNRILLLAIGLAAFVWLAFLKGRPGPAAEKGK